MSQRFLVQLLLGICFSLSLCRASAVGETGNHLAGPAPVSDRGAQGPDLRVPAKPIRIKGMDEAVNMRFAEEAGVPLRGPLINTEKMGDLWNTLLLLAGGCCGFVLGKWWHLLWKKGDDHNA